MNQTRSKLIAVVDDEPAICEEISAYLVRKRMRVECFSRANELFEFLKKEKPDLVILDLAMPGISGFEACQTLRKNKRFAAIPIIMLSGHGEETDKVTGLDCGADDYIVKPFSLKELDARVKAVLRRRAPAEKSGKIVVANLVIDLQKYEVLLGGRKLNLTTTEFKILELLCAREGQVFTRERILDYLWSGEKIDLERTVDVHIRHLREKLGKSGTLIKNVRGAGYKFER